MVTLFRLEQNRWWQIIYELDWNSSFLLSVSFSNGAKHNFISSSYDHYCNATCSVFYLRGNCVFLQGIDCDPQGSLKSSYWPCTGKPQESHHKTESINKHGSCINFIKLCYDCTGTVTPFVTVDEVLFVFSGTINTGGKWKGRKFHQYRTTWILQVNVRKSNKHFIMFG